MELCSTQEKIYVFKNSLKSLAHSWHLFKQLHEEALLRICAINTLSSTLLLNENDLLGGMLLLLLLSKTYSLKIDLYIDIEFSLYICLRNTFQSLYQHVFHTV